MSFKFTPTLVGSTERAATPMVCSVPACESKATFRLSPLYVCYKTMASSRKLKCKLNDSTVELESCKKKLKLKQQKPKRLKQNTSTLSSVVARLEEELNLVSSSYTEILEASFDGVTKQVMQHGF